MFEKEAIRHAFEVTIGLDCLIKPAEEFTYEELDNHLQEKADDFQDGAEFGYNKAKEEGKVVVEHFEAYGQCRDSRRIASLEAENEKLKEQNIKFQKIVTEDFIKDVSVSMEYADKLEQAKELIRQLCLMVRELNNPNVQLTNVDYSLKEVEQFLKEVKENE